MSYIDSLCLEMDHATAQYGNDVILSYMEAGGEGPLAKLKKAIATILQKLKDGIDKLLGKNNKKLKKIEAGMRQFPEAKSKKVTVVDPNKQDSWMNKAMTAMEKAKNGDQIATIKDKLSNHKDACKVTVAVSAAVIILASYRKRHKKYEKTAKDKMGSFGKFGTGRMVLEERARAEMYTRQVNRMEQSKKNARSPQNLKNEKINAEFAKSGVDLGNFGMKMPVTKEIHADIKTAEEKTKNFLWIFNFFSKKELQNINEAEGNILEIVELCAVQRGYVWSENAGKFLKIPKKK